MTTIKQAYKVKYDNSFLSSASLFFVAFFISLWLFFFLHPFTAIALMSVMIGYLMWWHIKRDGTFELIIDEHGNELRTTGSLEIISNIKSIRWGWSYAFINPVKGLRAIAPFTFGMASKNNRSIQNTDQRIFLIQLENGENIALVQECKPWEEVGDLQFLGTLMDNMQIDYKLFYTGSFEKLKAQFASVNQNSSLQEQ